MTRKAKEEEKEKEKEKSAKYAGYDREYLISLAERWKEQNIRLTAERTKAEEEQERLRNIVDKQSDLLNHQQKKLSEMVDTNRILEAEHMHMREANLSMSKMCTEYVDEIEKQNKIRRDIQEIIQIQADAIEQNIIDGIGNKTENYAVVNALTWALSIITMED